MDVKIFVEAEISIRSVKYSIKKKKTKRLAEENVKLLQHLLRHKTLFSSPQPPPTKKERNELQDN